MKKNCLCDKCAFAKLNFFPACGKLSELGVGVKVRIWEFVFSQKIIDLDWFGFLQNNFKLKWN